MKNPSEWEGPVLLMNFPLSVSNAEPNNAWMDPSVQGEYDVPKAMRQWLRLYKALASKALVYVLPGHDNLQDLPYVANIGCYLPHLSEPTIILSNFCSPPRKGEEKIGLKFFSSFDYSIHQPHTTWEGEADLKWVRESLYVGGTKARSASESYEWMRKTFDMEVLEIELTDPKLYHLDCVFMPLTEGKALVNVPAIAPATVRELEKYMEVIPVPDQYVHAGWTNCVRMGHEILHAPGNMSYIPFAKLLDRHGFDLRIFDLSEFDKSGADLSCLVCHLNFKGR